MGYQGNKLFRLTRGQRSYEHGFFFLLISPLVMPIIQLAKDSAELVANYRRSLKYHPITLIGITVFITSYILTPWLLLVPVLVVFAWFVSWPESYIRHGHSRWLSFLAGFGYRHRLRRKLTACSLLNDKDPTPTISTIKKIGCITTVRIKMVYGDEIDMWRVQAGRLGQTYNAQGPATVNQYRRQTLNPFKKEQVTKPRWLILDFLTKDPFNADLGLEYINYHTADNLTPVVATHRNGQPHEHILAAHRLRVAMTRWGKSNAIRAMVYAHRNNIKHGLLELWGIDGKGGVEQSFMQHVFARVAYGDTQANPNAYNPAQFDRLLKDAVLVLKRRQRNMRGNTTEHTPTPSEPWLLIIIDELLVLTSKAIDSNLRNSIAASIMLIQQQGIACGVTIDASTQLAQKDRIDFRDGFTEFEVGKVEKGAVDMIFGTGWWERGARADEIAKDLKGVFYIKTDTTMAPTQIRYPNIPVEDMASKRIGVNVEKSVLWPLPPQNGSRNGPRTNGHRKTARVPQHAHSAPQGVSQPNGQHPVGDNGQTEPQPVEEAIPSSKEVQDYIGGFA